MRALQDWNIPERVTGGIVASLTSAALHAIAGVQASFVLDRRDGLRVIFFTTIGLSAN